MIAYMIFPTKPPSAIEQTRRRKKKTFNGARRFMDELESQDRVDELIEYFMRDSLKEVKSALQTDMWL